MSTINKQFWAVSIAFLAIILGVEIYSIPSSTSASGLPSPLIERDFSLDVSMNKVRGFNHISKFGRNPLITTATAPEDVWSYGGIWVAPTDARVHSIVSGSAADDWDISNTPNVSSDPGTGALTIKILGLDDNWEEASETVVLDGVVPVLTVGEYRRIYRMFNVTSGSNTINAGTITATAVVDGTVTAIIDIGKGQTLMAIYTVPAGKIAYITSVYATISRPTGVAIGADISLISSGPMDTAFPSSRTRFSWGVESSGSAMPPSFQQYPYASIPEKHDVKLRVNEVSGTSDISGGFGVILADN